MIGHLQRLILGGLTTNWTTYTILKPLKDKGLKNMKIARIIRKKPKISLILALLTAGMLLPWHSALFSEDSAHIRQLEDSQFSQGQLLAKQAINISGSQQSRRGEALTPSLAISQGNTVISLSQPPESTTQQKMRVVITAYSSTPDQTDQSPYVTAAGTPVRKGVVANNYLPFGTKIRIPEIYEDETFVVEDRMHWNKPAHHLDIWFPSRARAIQFGSKTTYIEILES